MPSWLIPANATEWLTLVLAATTLWYAWSTRKILSANKELVNETQLLRIAGEKPRIAINLLINQSSIIVLRIKNIGNGIPEALRFEIDKDFYRLGKNKEEENIRNFNFFKNEVESFPPGAEATFILCQGWELDKILNGKNLTPSKIKIKLKYKWIGNELNESHAVDISSYLQMNPIRNDIVHALEKIEKTLRNRPKT
jgi:hypothetical protein